MTSSFTYTAGPTERTYMSDRVSIAMIANGDQQRLLSGKLDQDVRDIALQITVGAVWEQIGASDKSPNALWLDLLAGTEISFKPDASASASLIIKPDLAHNMTLFSTQLGTSLEFTELRFLSDDVYQPGDSVMTSIAALKPFYGA